MDKDRLAEALRTTFLEELAGALEALTRDLLALEREPARAAALTAALVRTVHGVKGASRAVGARVVEAACHRLEEVLQVLGAQGADPARLELCLATVEALEEVGQRLARQHPLEGSPLEGLLPRLEQAAHPEPGAPARPVEAVPVGRAPEPGLTGAEGLPVRVSAQKLDRLLSRSAELRVAALRLEGRVATLEAAQEELARLRALLRGRPEEAAAARAEARVAGLARALGEDRRSLRHAVGELEEEVRRARTLPFAEVCVGLERSARSVARATGRRVRWEVVGGALELDRSLLQGLREPLVHLVGNAVAHGVEPPQVRHAAGKPEEGRVVLSARLRGNRVEVAVEDDGRGLDLEALRERAQALGVEVASEREAARLAFLPGLSTAPGVTPVAGRGVGLDVVRTQVEALRGRVEVSTRAGQGTRFALEVPLTLGTLRVLLVGVGGQRLALAAEDVERLLRLRPEQVQEVEGRRMWRSPQALVPLAHLAELLGLQPGPARPLAPAVVLAAGTGRAALVVEEVLAEQEVLVRGLGPRLRRVPHVAAAAVLPQGQPVLLLQAASLVRAAEGRTASAGLFAAPAVPPPRRRVLLAEDSPTTRALEQSLLESAGYEVLACADGQEAWARLQAEGAEALVSDVEMPGMDGIALTEAVRGSPRFHRLPVVLVTARERPEDRQRGVEAGASAWLVKSAFDQSLLLETLRQLL